jgi:hypothetical protein
MYFGDSKTRELTTMLDEDTLRRKIRRLDEAVWERRVPGHALDDWLSSFNPNNHNGVDERLQMLYLLSNFLYFGVREIRHLLRVHFGDLCRRPILQEIRANNGDTVDLDFIDRSYALALRRTRFLGVGNPSESGAHLLYYFRQENELASSLFINKIQLPGVTASEEHGPKHVDRYIFIDDLCATGDQAILYSQGVVQTIKRAHSKAWVTYFPLFATTFALQRVRTEAEFDRVASVVELDETFRCFADNCRFYFGVDAPIDRDAARQTSLYYGSVLCPRHPLGYKDSQLALGFSHNTPDNTLPIFWEEPNDLLPTWSPVFKRYSKLYG